jgi:hypothetical protein
MTEEEKKEYEEFLEWKKEHKKDLPVAEEQTIEESLSETSVPTEQDSVQKPDKVTYVLAWAWVHRKVVLLTLVILSIILMIVIGSVKNAKQAKEEYEANNSPAALARKAREDSIAHVNDSLERVEKLRIDSILHERRVKDVKHSIKIKSAYLSHPNSAGGVDAYFYYKNCSDKTIKYLIWEGMPINAVGDPVTCEIRDYSIFHGRDTGPVKPNASGGGVWGCAWYNWTAKKLEIIGVRIEYTDGSVFEIKEEEIPLIK